MMARVLAFGLAALVVATPALARDIAITGATVIDIDTGAATPMRG
jgi:hypothetical protein